MLFLMMQVLEVPAGGRGFPLVILIRTIIGLTSTTSTIRNIEDLTQTSFLLYQVQKEFIFIESYHPNKQIDAHCYIITSDIIITD